MDKEILVLIGYFLATISFVLFVKSFIKEIFKSSTLILFAAATIILAMTTYINSDHVMINKIGDQEKLGQFGDFVGGILNPIFGFITVILLITSLNFENKKSSLEKKNRDKDELLKLLKEAKKDCRAKIEEKIYLGTNFETESLVNIRNDRLAFEKAIIQVTNSIEILKSNPTPSLVDIVNLTQTNRIDIGYFTAIQQIYHQVIDIIKIYIAIIDNDFNQYSNKYYIRELNDFLVPIQLQLKILDHKQCRTYLQEACKKAGIDMHLLNLSFEEIKIN